MRMTLRRGVALFACLVLAGALLTACGGGDDGVETSGRDTVTTTTRADATTTGPPATTPSATVASDAPGVDLDVTFLRDGKVATAHRRVPPTQAVARAALTQLIAGPDTTDRAAGLTTVIRPEATLAGLGVANGGATVTLSPDIGRGYNDVTAEQATAQVVYTLTQFPTIQKVRIGTTGTPLSRDDLRDVTPLIFLESVAPGDTVSSPVTVAGESNTFEATVRIRVLGADGSVLADTFTTATSGTGTWGTFGVNVPFARGANATGKVVVFEDSPKDGSMVNVVEVPVRFS